MKFMRGTATALPCSPTLTWLLSLAAPPDPAAADADARLAAFVLSTAHGGGLAESKEAVSRLQRYKFVLLSEGKAHVGIRSLDLEAERNDARIFTQDGDQARPRRARFCIRHLLQSMRYR